MKSNKLWTIVVVLLVVFMSGFYTARSEGRLNKVASLLYMVGEVIVAPFYIDGLRDDIQYTEDRWQRKGVTINVEGKRDQSEYILYAQANSTTVKLINRHGREEHSWMVPYSKVWGGDQSHMNVPKKLSNDFFYIRDFHLYDDGSIVVMMNVAGTTPWGAGIIKVDKDSNVLWSWRGSTNNDLEITPEGNILITNQDIVIKNLTGIVEKAEDGYISAELVTLSPDGKELERVSIVDKVLKSEFRDMVKFYHIVGGDFLHMNSIDYISESHPEISWIKEGYILLSLRNMNTIAVFDPVGKEVVHAFRGGFVMQHDIDYHPDTGTFMVYDNRGALGPGGHTRILEFLPETNEEVWSYKGTKDRPFHSNFWGVQQRLSNNNVMTVEAEQGRLIEVTRDGEIVWEYFLSDMKELEGKLNTATISSFEAIGKEYLTWMH